MAETNSLKRLREDEEENIEELKRQKSYKDFLSLLEEAEDQEEPNQDLSYLITTLQQEISPDNSNLTPIAETQQNTPKSTLPPTEDDKDKKVIRHLLEASDDELGIPNTAADLGLFGFGETEQGHFGNLIDDDEGLLGFPSIFDDGLLWDLEDEAANYYTMLQSQIHVELGDGIYKQ